MAQYLASIFCTEKDKVNCSFFFKIGACRHGIRCSRIHTRPLFSQTILIQNLYQNPRFKSGYLCDNDGSEIEIGIRDDHFENFFEEVFVELYNKYGEIEEMNVCDNLGDHLVGNVYVKFKNEKIAEKAVNDLNNRWFDGRPIVAELSPVTDFDDACCRQYEEGKCLRNGYCNFMHLKKISDHLFFKLYGRKPKPRFKYVTTEYELNDYLQPRHRPRSRSRKQRNNDEKKRQRSASPTRTREHSNRRLHNRGLKRKADWEEISMDNIHIRDKVQRKMDNKDSSYDYRHSHFF